MLGPGPNKKGQGHEVNDLEDWSTDLKAKNGRDLFVRSWNGIWAPLKTEGLISTSDGDNAPSPTAIVGIVVETVVICLVTGTAAFFLRCRKRKLTAQSASPARTQSDRVTIPKKILPLSCKEQIPPTKCQAIKVRGLNASTIRKSYMA